MRLHRGLRPVGVGKMRGLPGLIADAPALALDLEVKSASNGSLVEAGTYRLCLTLGASDHAPQNYESQLVFRWIVLAAITRFQELTVKPKPASRAQRLSFGNYCAL